MKQLAVSKQFQKQLKKLPPQTREKCVQTLKDFLIALQTKQLPQGFGFKKINCDKYEIRVDIQIRIVMKADGDILVCHLVGNHEDVKRFLREYRNK